MAGSNREAVWVHSRFSDRWKTAATILRTPERKSEEAGGEAWKNLKPAPEQQPKKPKCTISIKNFSSLAEYIASYKPPGRVPGSFVTAINRAISVRREFGGQVSEHTRQNAQDRHGYFIGVLEHVRDILRHVCQGLLRSNLPTGSISSRHRTLGGISQRL